MIPKRYINATDPIAFILGSYLTSGLGVVRNLGKIGITTVVLASNKNQLSFFQLSKQIFIFQPTVMDLKRSEITLVLSGQLRKHRVYKVFIGEGNGIILRMPHLRKS